MRGGILLVSALVDLVLALVVHHKVSRATARIEHGDDGTAEKVHALQRLSFFALLLLPLGLVIGITPMRLVSHPSARHHTEHHSPAVVIVAAVLIVAIAATWLAPMLAASIPVRRALVRVRGIERKRQGRLRQVLLFAGVGLTFGVLWGFIRAELLPHHGAGRFIGYWIGWGLMILLVNFLATPVLVIALRSKPMDERNRDRIAALARRAGVKVRDIRVIPGRGQKLANAAQIGAVPPLRYIVVTDYLIDNLPADEVDAVVAHELGHARHHHVFLKLMTLIGTVVGIEALLRGAAALFAGPASGLIAIGLLVALPAGLILSQGIVGIRLERQADDEAAQLVSPEALASALTHIGELNHTTPRTGWWWNVLTQHPGIAERTERLRRRVRPSQPVLTSS